MAPLQLSLSSFEFYTRTLRPPRLSPSPAVDAELQSLLYLILKDFVGSWYGAISNNDEFYAEVVASIAGVIAGLETRLRKVRGEIPDFGQALTGSSRSTSISCC